MTTAESRRHDLYNGLAELLGADQADTLMTYLPHTESEGLATKADLDALERNLSGRIDGVDKRLDLISHRLNRIVLALVAGLVAIIATLVAQSFI
jgi:hypothetical protein